MDKLTPNQIKKQLGISYLGSCTTSPKLIKSLSRNVMTYGLYLAPHNISGYQVCPESCNCSPYCLHASGRNKLELLKNKGSGSIEQSRIKKTKYFFEHRAMFMHLLIHEIKQAIQKAAAESKELAVRLNCTSDINLEEFVFDGKNILQLFPQIQFYDYTKVPAHLPLTKKYANYDLTFSYSGEDWELCEKLLNNGFRVSAVFEDKLPKRYRGYSVIDANKVDARYLDDTGIICGLTYKKVANDYATGKYNRPDTTFITKVASPLCTW